MKKPSPPTSSEHPDALLLPYVEDMITPAEKADVEEHLSTCDQCAVACGRASRDDSGFETKQAGILPGTVGTS